MNFIFFMPDELRAESVGCFEGRANRDQFARTSSHIYYPKGRLQQTHPDSVGRVTMLRTSTHKLVQRPTGVCEFYDLVADQQELHNQYGAPEHSAVQQQLEQRMLNWLIQTADVTPFEMDPRGF